VSQHEKFKAKLFSRPYPTDIKFNDLIKFLQREGFALVRIKGSHHILKKQKYTITLPKQNPVKFVYIAEVVKLLKQIESEV